MLSDLPLNPTKRILRQFAGAWFVVFLIAAIRASVHGHKTAGIALVLIALVGIAGLVKPILVKHLFLGATIAAYPLGWTLTQIMLAIMFYIVLTPIALIARWRGRDSLQLRRQTTKSTCWAPRGEPPPAENYLKQF
jgi:hypothetical protein